MTDVKLVEKVCAFMINLMRDNGIPTNGLDAAECSKAFIEDQDEIAKFAVWNKEKHLMHWGFAFEKYEDVKAYEDTHGSLSSVITCRVRDIGSIIEAIQNETDVVMSYERLP